MQSNYSVDVLKNHRIPTDNVTVCLIHVEHFYQTFAVQRLNKSLPSSWGSETGIQTMLINQRTLSTIKKLAVRYKGKKLESCVEKQSFLEAT